MTSPTGLRGFVGQAMAAKKKQTFQDPIEFPNLGAATFRPPVAGRWKFVGWGPGGNGNNGVSAGASGGYIEITRFLTPKDVVAIFVGSPLGGGSDTTVTMPNGVVATAGRGIGAIGGVASGGNVSISGTAGVSTGTQNGQAGAGTAGGLGGNNNGVSSGGAGAPGNSPYQGGNGQGQAFGIAGRGGGGSENGTGALGFVIAVLVGT